MHTITQVVEAKQQTCSPGITSALTESRPATRHQRGNLGSTSTRLSLLLAKAGQGIPCTAEAEEQLASCGVVSWCIISLEASLHAY